MISDSASVKSILTDAPPPTTPRGAKSQLPHPVQRRVERIDMLGPGPSPLYGEEPLHCEELPIHAHLATGLPAAAENRPDKRYKLANCDQEAGEEADHG